MRTKTRVRSEDGDEEAGADDPASRGKELTETEDAA